MVGGPPGRDVEALKEGISGVGGDGDARDGLRFGGEGVCAAGGLSEAVAGLGSALRAGDFPGTGGCGGIRGGKVKVEEDIV